MRKIVMALLIALWAVPALAAEPPKAPVKEQKPLTPEEQKKAAEEAARLAAETKADEEKTLYNVGIMLARQLKVFSLSPEEYQIVLRGLNDGASGTTPTTGLDAVSKKIQALGAKRRDLQGEKVTGKAVREYLDSAAEEVGATKTETGMVYKVLREGTGVSPTPVDKVKVNYVGTYIDGREFDSTYKNGAPAEIPLASAIRCWSDGLPMMKVGGKSRLYCPPATAYSNRGVGIIPPNATLIYEIELLGVN